MSEQQEDLELQALQRRLDDAFETTRPRRGFEDELWTRMQEQRPAGARWRGALAGLVQGIRDVPAVPLAGVAALLVVVLGIGLFAYSGLGRGASSTTEQRNFNGAAGVPPSAASFGRLPSPLLPPIPKTGLAPSTGAVDYSGQVQLVWSGHLVLVTTTAPVFRYREPSTATADQFATALGAVLRSRPAGYLGSYAASDYTLEVRGTVQSPPQSPAYFVYSAPTMPPVEATGAGPADVAQLFLAQHSLVPDWSYTTAVDASADPARVVFEREFVAEGYGEAYLVDASGQRYGMEVDVSGGRAVHVAGLLPVSLDTALYPIISVDAAVRAAVGSGAAGPQIPTVQLTEGELAYILVPAGDHSFYEPVFVFSGSFQVGGKTYVKHVIVPAVDPSQRTP